MSNRGSYYYEEEDDLDIRVTRQRSRSPGPQYYDAGYRHTRPVYQETHSYSGPGYSHPSGAFLIPAASGSIHRSRSHGRRTPPTVIHSPPQQAPVIINKIYNDREEEDDYHLQLSHRPRSRSRAGSFNAAARDPRDDYELEKARKELAAYKLEKDRAEEKKRIAKELELERLRKEKEEDEEEEKMKEERKKAIEKYKLDEADKAAKAKKEKEEREREYQRRLEDDLRKSGLDQRQIAVVLKKDAPPPKVDGRPTYTRMSRRHLSIETLNKFRIEYEYDQDPEYILIRRWVPEYEQDFLWSHTREIREKRVTLLTIEAKEKHKKHHKDEVEFEFVRKKKHERKPSPSPLLNFLAGGKR